MKQLVVKIGIVVVIVSLSMIGCKTTEQNYKQAYLLARESKKSDDDALMATLVKQSQDPQMTMVNGEQLPMRKEFVSIISQEGDPKVEIKRYNVVVGRFRQIFNARSMRQRMCDLGYNSYVLSDRQPVYYVAVESTDTIENALELYKKVKEDTRMVLKAPFPWVLEPAQYIRQKAQK